MAGTAASVRRWILPALALCVLCPPSVVASPKAADREFTLRPAESAALSWQKGRITYDGVEDDLPAPGASRRPRRPRCR